MTVREWICEAQDKLRLASCQDWQAEPRFMISGVLNISLSALFQYMTKEISEGEHRVLSEMLARRQGGEPLQYIENTAYFIGLSFYVDKRVLIPRQDTETLAEKAIEIVGKRHNAKVFDLCTGSGCLAVSIKKYCPNADVTASDISKGALEVAETNAKKNACSVRFCMGDGFSPVNGETFDLIVCNPPYLTREDMENLQEEVKREPALALLGGDDGLDMYRRFAQDTPKHLKSGGYALFEVGADQAEDVLKILLNCADYAESGYITDLNGIKRVVWVRSRE